MPLRILQISLKVLYVKGEEIIIIEKITENISIWQPKFSIG